MPTAERLLDVAEKILATEGIDAVTLRRIAREAGVSHGAPLRHYPSLRALLSAVAARAFEDLAASVQHAVSAAADGPQAALRAAAHGYVGYALAHPGAFALMFREDVLDFTDPTLAAAGSRAFDDLVDLVVGAQSAGLYAGRDARQVAGVLWATVHGMAHLWLGGVYAGTTGTSDIALALDLMVDLYGTKEPT